jgi:ABC-2 type transport system permease protein
MIHEIITVMRKELREITGDRYARRGALVQSAVMILALGVLFPSSSPDAWVNASPQPLVFFLLFPGIVAATVAADAFAGEQERKTLETLLATPLSDRGILFGKAAAAFSLGASVAVVALVVSMITLSVKLGTAFVLAPTMLLGALGAAMSSATLLTAASIHVSLRVPVARSAQQTTSILSLLVFAGVSFAWKSLGIALTWQTLGMTELALATLGLVLLEVARAQFHRERFFERR